MKHKMLPSVLAAAVAMSVAADTHAADATGAGASFVYPVMSQWSADYHAATGRQVNYQSIGSSGGMGVGGDGHRHRGGEDGGQHLVLHGDSWNEKCRRPIAAGIHSTLPT